MMLDLDNLDLDLDEDFPTDPLDRSNLFERSFTSSLSWNGNKSENSVVSKSNVAQKNVGNSSQKEATNNPILKILESAETEQKKENVNNIVKDSLNTSDIFNTSFGPNKFFNTDKNIWNRSKDLGKRILTHRKFPGPAGLLPDKPLKDLSDINVIVDSSVDNVTADRQQEAVILCSQTSSVYSEASFKKLALDFDLNRDNCPLNKYTVEWVKKRALKKTLCGKKIPFLAVVLHNLDHGTPDPVITMRDQTGEVYGTLHREVWSELGGKLQPGAALALRQVGVLITGIARRQVHLNITSNNIINIYSYSDEEIVETNCVNELDKSDLIKSINEWQILTEKKGAEQKMPSNPFSTFGGNKAHSMANSSNQTLSSNKAPATKSNSIKNNIHQNNMTSMENTASSKSVEPKNCINFMSSMEDDMSDFLASLDESDLGDNFLGGVKSTGVVANVDRDNNIRKRKIDSEDINTPNKAYCSTSGEKNSVQNGYGPPAKKKEYQEKFITGSQQLSQAESQIVEEVLDGIDFDDFDN